jgi:hypothetical protein
MNKYVYVISQCNVWRDRNYRIYYCLNDINCFIFFGYVFLTPHFCLYLAFKLWSKDGNKSTQLKCIYHEIILVLYHIVWSRDSVVGIATGYNPDDRGVGVQVLVGVRMFTSPCCPDQLWGPPNLLSNGYQRLFPRG